jgi:hypothetical protein
LPQEQIPLHELNQRINNEFATAISVVFLAATACQVILNPPVNLVDGSKEQPLCAVVSLH